MTDVEHIFDWLVDGTPGAVTPMAVLDRLCPDLAAAGVPVGRVEAFVRTLHPHVVGRSFLWTPGRPVAVRENSWAYLQSAGFLQNPVSEVFRTGQETRLPLEDGEAVRRYALLGELRAEGFTDFYAGPLRFTSGEVHAITFATGRPGGFEDEHLAALRRVLRPLSLIAEILALRRTAMNLLNTYVGHDAGERILAGKIQRGDSDTIRAVLWFSDLRGFTSLSNVLPPASILRILNDLFDCQVPAIERRGGEVLKFMGDGLLAIFPFGPPGSGASEAAMCDAALDAAAEAYAAAARLDAERAAAGHPAIRFGLALHVGEFAYGNIGGSQRLDFTCIGPAVNLAARLEGLTARLERRAVVSAAFARATTRPLAPLGRFELKGIPDPVEVFGPAELE